MFRKTRLALSAIAMMSLASTVMADDRHTLLDHRGPTGMAGRWSAVTRPGIAGSSPPVRIQLPSTGEVTFYSMTARGVAETSLQAPAVAGIGVGYVYRVAITNLPEFPGATIYPTIELLDRINPPAGLELEFPIPIQITEEEIEIALQDRMVTKVVYLEHPDRAVPIPQEGRTTRVEQLRPSENLIQAADQRGRPLAIIRIGGRVPTARGLSDEFFSTSPLQFFGP